MCQNYTSHFRKINPVGRRVQNCGLAVYRKATLKLIVSTIQKHDVTSCFLYLRSLFSISSSYHNIDLEHHIWSHCSIQPRAVVAGQWEPDYKTSGLLSRVSCSPGIQLKNEFFEETSPSNHLHSGNHVLQIRLKHVLCNCFLYASLSTFFFFSTNSYSTQLYSLNFAIYLKAFPSPKEFWFIIYFCVSYIINKVLSGRTGERKT